MWPRYRGHADKMMIAIFKKELRDDTLRGQFHQPAETFRLLVNSQRVAEPIAGHLKLLSGLLHDKRSPVRPLNEYCPTGYTSRENAKAGTLQRPNMAFGFQIRQEFVDFFNVQS